MDQLETQVSPEVPERPERTICGAETPTSRPAEAQAAGSQAECYAQQVLERLLRTNPVEWARHFDAWLDKQDPKSPGSVV